MLGVLGEMGAKNVSMVYLTKEPTTDLAKDVEKSQALRLRFLKVFTSTWLTTLLVVASYLLLALVFFLFPKRDEEQALLAQYAAEDA